MILGQIIPNNIQNSVQVIALSLFMGGASLIIPILLGSLSVLLGIDVALHLLVIFGIIAFVLVNYLRKIV